MPIEFSKFHFAEAIKFFRQKVNLPTEKWTDIMDGMHTRGFVVAGAAKNELLVDLRTAVDKAISEGTTLNDFRKAFDETVQKNGWSYKGSRGWRTGVIFDTNLRTAYAEGHYQQSMAVKKDRPYWRYIGGLSISPRPLHLSWNGLVLPADDPWWDEHYPPKEWGCKCKVVSHSKEELERDGWKIAEKSPNDGTYEWTNPDTGEVKTIPKGVAPGFNYPIGKAAWGENQAKRLMEDKGPWTDLDPWGPSAYNKTEKIDADEPKASLGNKAHSEKELRESLKIAIGGDEAGFKDPAGETVMVTQAIADHMLENNKRIDGREQYFPFIKELIEDPYEIWVSFAKSEVSGRVGIRRKYIKEIQLDKNTVLGLYAEFRNGLWVSGNFFRGGATGAGNLRKGRLLYGR